MSSPAIGAALSNSQECHGLHSLVDTTGHAELVQILPSSLECVCLRRHPLEVLSWETVATKVGTDNQPQADHRAHLYPGRCLLPTLLISEHGGRSD